jgi:hypothetical protein
MTTGKPSAKLLINEVAPNIGGSVDANKHDLVELLVTQAGSTAGLKLQINVTGNATTLATFPAVDVAAGDIIVVHLNPPSTVTAETNGKGECDATGDTSPCPDNYNGAWDFVGSKSSSNDIGYSARVLAIVTGPAADPASYMDAVPFYRSGVTLAANFLPDVKFLVDNGLWHAFCPNDCASNADAGSISVAWEGVGTDKAGATVQRQPHGADDGKAADWQAVPATNPNTLGAPN